MNRPVHIVLPGPSVSGLEQRIEHVDVKYPGAYWAGINRYDVLEEKILSKIGKQFEYFYYSDPYLLVYYLDAVKDFLARPSRNHFICGRDTIRVMEARGIPMINANGTVTYSSYNEGKNVEVCDQFYNSLTCLLLTLISLGQRDFVLFGADGGGTPDQAYYLQGEATHRDYVPVTELCRRLEEDTNFMNKHFWTLVGTITPDPVNITNVSPNSMLTCFKKFSYEEFLA